MTMSNKTVEEKIKKVVMDKFKIDASKVTNNARFTDDIGADSLDLAELIMLFEEEFECEIPQADAEKIKTVQDAIDYVSKKSAE
jgi:acyl carrier protein